MSELKHVTTKAGEAIGFPTEFFEDPRLNVDFAPILADAPEQFKKRGEDFMKDHPPIKRITDKAGRFERFDYQTGAYEDGKIYRKYCNVYLPYGYDDSDRKYNVIYFQHGNTGDPEFFRMPVMKELLDRLYETGEIDPCIMVFTTYYFDVMKDADERKKTGNVPAGDGNWPGVVPNFWKEITEDLIPAVESEYRTYLKGTDAASVKAARDHRLFSGYSRGCVATWYMFHNAFEYFRYFIPMSCVTTAGKTIADKLTDEEVAEYLTAPVKAHPELPYYLYAFNGGMGDIPGMSHQIDIAAHLPEFSFGKDPAADHMYYSVTGYFHGDFFAPQYYNNALRVIKW